VDLAISGFEVVGPEVPTTRIARTPLTGGPQGVGFGAAAHLTEHPDDFRAGNQAALCAGR